MERVCVQQEQTFGERAKENDCSENCIQSTEQQQHSLGVWMKCFSWLVLRYTHTHTHSHAHTHTHTEHFCSCFSAFDISHRLWSKNFGFCFSCVYSREYCLFVCSHSSVESVFYLAFYFIIILVFLYSSSPSSSSISLVIGRVVNGEWNIFGFNFVIFFLLLHSSLSRSIPFAISHSSMCVSWVVLSFDSFLFVIGLCVLFFSCSFRVVVLLLKFSLIHFQSISISL